MRSRFSADDILERAAPRDLIDVARIAHAMLLRQLVEERLGLVNDDAGCAARLRVGEASLLEHRHVDARSREHIRRRATQRSAADDGHLGLQVAAMPRIGRPPGRTESGPASSWFRKSMSWRQCQTAVEFLSRQSQSTVGARCSR